MLRSGLTGPDPRRCPSAVSFNSLLGVTNGLGLDALPIQVDDLLSTVLDSVLNTKTLNITIGDAVSETVRTPPTP